MWYYLGSCFDNLVIVDVTTITGGYSIDEQFRMHAHQASDVFAAGPPSVGYRHTKTPIGGSSTGGECRRDFEKVTLAATTYNYCDQVFFSSSVDTGRPYVNIGLRGWSGAFLLSGDCISCSVPQNTICTHTIVNPTTHRFSCNDPDVLWNIRFRPLVLPDANAPVGRTMMRGWNPSDGLVDASCDYIHCGD